MTFFNRKEEVIDIELTQYGKLLLSKGKFKPKKYAFFDDDIVYDAQYATPTDRTSVAGAVEENQNDISTRIKESVRSHAQHNYGDAYNLGEIEEAEESVLMSTSVKNFKGIEYELVSTDAELVLMTKTFEYSDYTKYFPAGQQQLWIAWMMNKINKIFLGQKKTYSTQLKSYSQFKIEVDANALNPDDNTLSPKITLIKYYPYTETSKKAFPTYETSFETMEFGKSRTVFDHDLYYEGLPLGSMELKNQKMPAWDILSLNDKEINLRSLTLDLFSSPPGNKPLDNFNTKYYTYGNLPIPQISADIKVRTILDDDKTINLLEEDIVESQRLIDGLTLRVKNDYLLLIVDEKNTYFENENFDIEVFEMQNNSKPATATFVVSAVGSISNGQTLKFTTYDGALYSAAVDTSVTKDNSTATVIGTSGVSTDADLAESISNSINSFNKTQYTVVDGVEATFNEIGSTGDQQFVLQQAGFTEVYTKEHAVQGTLFTDGVLTSLVNWDEDPASKTLKRLYFSKDATNMESGMLYSPEEATAVSATPVSDTHVAYYLNVLVDEEIDSQLFNKYQDKLKNMRVDKLLKPEVQTNPNNFNIYGDDTEDPGSIC
tara:strand:- start:3469 stop:5277 length:1809 start_codon:yes stop_codon:yes gene_type:complete